MAETEKIQFHRPANNDEFKQSALEKNILSYAVLFGCSNMTAYGLYHPELCDASGKLNKAGMRECKMFFTHPNNVAYTNALKAHLEALSRGTVKAVSNDTINDSRKDNALKSLLNQAMSLVEKGEDLDAESLKTISEIFKKVGLLKDEVEVQEAPRRYIPAKCRAECVYRLFVESNIEGGSIINDCDYCRTRKFAEENGWHYDPTKNLDLPKELTNQNKQHETDL